MVAPTVDPTVQSNQVVIPQTAVSMVDTPVPTLDLWQQTTGFDPVRDGFSFRNYGFAEGVSNLLPVDMQRLFGDSVCRRGDVTSECELIPAADVWMTEINRAMQTGHCEGMAVLSQYMYYGIVSPDRFGASDPAALDLQQNPTLQREIAYWWATQATYPTRAHRVMTTPQQLVDQLKVVLHDQADVDELYTIGMYRADFSSGHTVTPIGIAQIDETTVAIRIYDNNVPAETQNIYVNTQSNTWQYRAPNLHGEVQEYAGDAQSNNLELTSAAPRLEQQVCHFCPDYTTADVIEEMTTFFFSSSAPQVAQLSKQFSAYFIDTLGRRVGVIKGRVFNEIPEAELGFLRGSDSQWSPLGLPMIAVPESIEGVVRLSGAADVPVNISAFGPGTVVALQNMQLATDAVSEIKLDQRAGQVVVASAAASAPDIVVGYTTADRNVSMTVKNIKLNVGGKAALKADQRQDDVQVVTSEEQRVNVNVVRAQSNQVDTQNRDVAVQSQTSDQELSNALSEINVEDGDVDVRPEDANAPPNSPILAPTRRPNANPAQQATAQAVRRTTQAATVTPRNISVADDDDDSAVSELEGTAPPDNKPPTRTRPPTRDNSDTNDDTNGRDRPTSVPTQVPAQPTVQPPAAQVPTATAPRTDDDNRDNDEQDDDRVREPSRTARPQPTPPAQATRQPPDNNDDDNQPRPTRKPDDDNQPRPTKKPDNDNRPPKPTKKPGSGEDQSDQHLNWTATLEPTTTPWPTSSAPAVPDVPTAPPVSGDDPAPRTVTPDA